MQYWQLCPHVLTVLRGICIIKSVVKDTKKKEDIGIECGVIAG